MAVTLVDLVRGTLDSVYSFMQVKDKVLYLNADIQDSDTSFVAHSTAAARQIQEGSILQFSTDDSAQAELVRVRSVDTTSNTVTIVRAVLGTTALDWDSIDTEVRIDPEYPIPSVVRAINQEITGFPPHIWGYSALVTTVDTNYIDGYFVHASAVGVVSVEYAPLGTTSRYEKVRRWKFDFSTKTLNIFGYMDPGATLVVTYRVAPTELALDADDLSGAFLGDEHSELVQMGATYRLLMRRASGRLVDTRSETPLNGQYRTADPVMSATRQLYAMYQERLKAERERQRLAFPVPLHYEL